MAKVDHWYMREVFLGKTAASIAWSVLLLIPSLALFLLLVRIDLFHPYLWLQGYFKDLFSVNTILQYLLIATVTSLVAVFNAKFYTVTMDVPLNRLAVLWRTLNPYKLLHTFCHGIAAGIITWSLTNLIGSKYDSLIVECEQHEDCLNEKHLFIMLHGILVGFWYSVHYFMNQENYMAFPVIQQANFFKVKSYLTDCVVSSVWKTWQIIKYFYVVYFFFGSWPREWFLYNLDLKATFSTPLNTAWGLLDLELFFYTSICSTVIQSLWYLPLYLFQVYNTDVFVFPVESMLNEEGNKCLPVALSDRSVTLVHYLAFLDLATLSEFSFRRRKQIFSLSQPGGHPHNWNSVCMECLALIEALTNRLTIYQDSIQADGMFKQQRLSEDSNPLTSQDLQNIGRLGADQPFSQESSHVEPSSGVISRHVLSPSGKLTQTGLYNHADTQRPVSTSFRQHSDHNGTTSDVGVKVNKKMSLVEKLKKKPLLAYFVNPLPEATSQQIFADAQLQIWALTALSRLVATSYSEDEFGVVQKSLPEILTGLLTLHQAVEKHFKLPIPSAKLSKQMKTSVRSTEHMKHALKATVKSSIYRIVSTFGEHLRNVKISTVCERHLQHFMEYKK